MTSPESIRRRARHYQIAALAFIIIGAVGLFFSWQAGAALWALAIWLQRDAQAIRS